MMPLQTTPLRSMSLLASALAALLAFSAVAHSATQAAIEGALQPATEPIPDPTTDPTTEPASDPADPGDGDDPLITFSETAEPMELTALVDFVANTLNINISVRGELRGSVLFNTSKSVRTSKLLPLLDAMLEQNDFSITYDSESEFYQIQPKANIPVSFEGDGELASTKLIEIPNIKPSSLSDAINQILGNASGGQGGNAQGVTFIDELGLIIITNTSRQIARVEQPIERILARTDELVLTPIELQFISAPTARERLIALAGGAPASSGVGNNRNIQNNRNINNQNNQNANIGPTAGSTIENLAERLAVDPQSNSLLFRGTPDELERVRSYVAVIDVDNNLPSKRHFVGSAARQIAELASGRGLGEVVVLDDTVNQQNTQFGGNNRNFQQQNAFGSQNDTTVLGPTLVVDVRNGEIVYYGTQSQQEILEDMIANLDTEADRVIIRSYRLNHALAEEVADIITTLISGQNSGQGGLLPQNRGLQGQQTLQNFDGGGGGDEIGGGLNPNEVFIVADVPNNQVIVRAPVKQQDDLAQLVEKLDLRRRQVYIEVLIVSIDDNEDFRFALDTQFQLGQYAGQTNFGLTQPGVGDNFTDPNQPIGALTGLTTALIKSEYVPFVLTAVKNETDGRILSRPQLLVNDNEEASIISVEEVQTTTTSQGDGGTITSVGEPVTAGTTLTVTPGISEAGFLRLEYAITFDNFIGLGTDTLPPPANRREVNGSVTMPTDTTIVVGGLTVENSGNTIVKIPILGDIPIIGPLFADTRTNDSQSVLYIFITPRILVDPDYRDLRLLSEGPQFQAGIDLELPQLEPVAIERVPAGADTSAPADRGPARREDDASQ